MSTDANYRLEVDLPGVTPLNAAGNMHWRAKDRVRGYWRDLIHYTVGPMGKPAKALEHARVTITRCTSEAGDGDNLDNCAKWILDGLVASRVLQDDGPKYIGKARVQWRYAPPSKSHTLVEVVACTAEELDLTNWNWEGER